MARKGLRKKVATRHISAVQKSHFNKNNLFLRVIAEARNEPPIYQLMSKHGRSTYLYFISEAHAASHLPDLQDMSIKDKNSTSSLDNAAAAVRNDVAETAVAFLVDCGLSDQDLTAGIWEMAFEYAYKPHPRFWRDIDLVAVAGAITREFPNWQRAMDADGGQTAEEILKEVDHELFCMGFFEAMAEMMMKTAEIGSSEDKYRSLAVHMRGIGPERTGR